MGANEDIELLPCSFQFHNFYHEVNEVRIQCQIMKMEKSLYLWLGDYTERTMNDLALAFATDSENKKTVLSTKIMGHVADETSLNIANRLSKKAGQPVYVSYNLNLPPPTLLSLERRIHEEFKSKPELLDS
ncbi:PREDICTED: uncharacterized protein LOC105362964 [Ceratosolen solmsi marchali]|uniref:Uncharacterized protein LOC105362964 n=1 Tax=Ceratosolen solmsi marchali TaxID=326594 RepID=A0AAJ7DWC5_9HYME|nr:PREDICTED: uncharacterized protein LOC105362964 [Ceratosolen solmsi marchali]